MMLIRRRPGDDADDQDRWLRALALLKDGDRLTAKALAVAIDRNWLVGTAPESCQRACMCRAPDEPAST